MYKLLTEEGKKNVRREYIMRRTAVMLGSLIAVMLVALVGMFPSYILSLSKEREVMDRMRTAEVSSIGGENAELLLWLEKIHRELSYLHPALDDARPSETIGKFLEGKPAGIRITNIRWTRLGGEELVSASGIAVSRANLIDLERNTESSGYFSTVKLPVSNLAKDRDISFQINASRSN